jgi:acetylserotonin N-methyltransferase
MHPPSAEDRPIWDLWLSQYCLPVVLAADQLGVFEFLRERPAGLDRICAELGLLRRSAAALTSALSAMGFLVQHRGSFQLTPVARAYLLADSEFYWVPMLRGPGFAEANTQALLRHLRTENLGQDDAISRRWERGEMTPEEARAGNRRMHSHSFPAALGLADSYPFHNVHRLLDVAGGSGCYAIAIALRHPHLRCTVADLPPVAQDARTYIEQYGCQSRVDTLGFNMFSENWPEGYDAMLMTNILHDWDAERRAHLIAASFNALSPGGRLFIHEILFNDAQDGPLAAALFSVMMLGTRGKQFSFVELQDALGPAGFIDVQVTPTYGYYSLVSATKEAV